MSDKFEKVMGIVKDLEPYIKLEGTEIGEVCTLMSAVASYPDYVSDEFYDALIVELESQLKMFKEQCKIVETTETFTRVVRDLEWE